MVMLRGTGVSDGVGFGVLHFIRAAEPTAVRRKIGDIAGELERLDAALFAAKRQLGVLYELALERAGEKEAEIFDIHQMMLEDEDYLDAIREVIREGKAGAEYAVGVAAETFAGMFAGMDDPYMQARSADVRDISDRLIRVLSGEAEEDAGLTERSIVAAADLTPSQTLRLDKDLAAGFVTEGGSQNSHAAILARTMGIPAVIGVSGLVSAEHAGLRCIIDGTLGDVYLDPDEETVLRYEAKAAELARQRRLRQALKGRETVTKSGRKIQLCANAGSVGDVVSALQNDAEGIGLFRTEFLYLEGTDYPAEEAQFEVYRQAAEAMAGRTVIFRTLDVGADKQAPYFGLTPEENPALGLRGIRVCLERQGLLRTQLRALYRASAFGKIAIMFPMIISVWELRQAKEIADEVRRSLVAEGIPHDPALQIGIMIETPAAALLSDELAEEADFFSVGTNDLTQYTLAIDRQNHALERFYDPHHPALLRLLRMTVENAHKKGIWVGICGELAGDLSLLDTFLEMGIDELSVSPAKVLELRERVLGRP